MSLSRWKSYWTCLTVRCKQEVDCLKSAGIDPEHEFAVKWGTTLRTHIESFYNASSVLRRFCARYVIPYYSSRQFHHGTLVVRNKKDGMADRRLSFRFRPSHPYWSIAFYGHFDKDRVEGGNTFLLRLSKMGMTYEVIELYCALTRLRWDNDRRKVLETYMYTDVTDYDEFEKRIQMCTSLFEMWCDSSLIETVMMNYINVTLYNKGFTSLRRLELFLTRNALLSRYIWQTNFSTEKQRRCLGVAMDISNKQLGGFIKSETPEQLREWLDKKKQPTLTKYDKLPDYLQREITAARQKLEKAKRGTGFYISSDEINACERNLFDAWRKADQWIGKNRI